ncbi:hypothetical protein K1T35_17290 [Pseudonocardia sp. DSM 110487]|uniref:hypothetical protein n=1 Tax=Pseudonocardia sp. DSM 110487 TaxID=2865833 RepID=UPI001C69586B|nr:hypothetical protein [Pseudonocardia sp. DSM 110487]QYN38801.1 hypothetical protein K1T35_17290 [Pseudonocardia sp. DSM 110487]
MDISKIAERLRRRAAELEQRPPLETLRDFVRGHVDDAESLDEIRTDLRRLAAVNTRSLKRALRAFDAILAEPQSPGLLSWLVAWDANWVLDDETSDEAAAAFLRQLADILREVLAEAERRASSEA